MNALVQITELHRQNEAHRLRQKRLWSGPVKVMAPVDIQPLLAKSKKPRGPRTADPKLVRELAESKERVRTLELDLADARARILSQAEMLCQLDDKILEDDEKRPVAVIVAEVLENYPDVTWAEIKSIRRTERLVGPRQACVHAVFLQRPDLSSTQIGRIFAREHSSILHCIRKMAKAEKMTST